MPASPEAGALLLQALERQGEGVVFIGAHPDDETFALGGHLPRLSRAIVVIVTDGAPRDLRDANKVGFETAEAYAGARAVELVEAVALAGIGPEQVITFGVPDQQPIYRLPEVSRRIAELFRTQDPWLVLTHAYEGGHPDHDAVALAVHAAVRLLRADGASVPIIVEMPYYRAGPDGAVTQSFPQGEDPAPYLAPLDEAQLELKSRMMNTHASQLRLFGRSSASFRTRFESFRVAPEHDFSVPPNGGRVLYEAWRLGITGEGWMAEARKALGELGFAA